MVFVRKIIATVAMPALLAVLPFGGGAGFVLSTIVTMQKQTAITNAEIQRVGLRFQRSENPKTYTEQVTNFCAPKRPVMSSACCLSFPVRRPKI